MAETAEARSLLAGGKYREAGQLLDRLIASEKGNAELWYLRGIASLKQRSYERALECFETALSLERKSRYHQIKGMAHFEMFEVEEAEEEFLKALALDPGDATTNFFLGMCYLFMDDPRSEDYVHRAYTLNGKRTRQLLMNFYSLFLKNDPKIGAAQKRRVEERIKNMR